MNHLRGTSLTQDLSPKPALCTKPPRHRVSGAVLPRFTPVHKSILVKKTPQTRVAPSLCNANIPARPQPRAEPPSGSRRRSSPCPPRGRRLASPRPGDGGGGASRARSRPEPGPKRSPGAGPGGRGGVGADRGGLRALFVPCDGGRSRGCSLPAARPATGAARRGPGSRLRRDPARPLPWGGPRTVGTGGGTVAGVFFFNLGWRLPSC